MKERNKFTVFYIIVILLSIFYCIFNWKDRTGFMPLFYPVAYLGTIVLVALANPLFLKKRFTTGVLIWFSVYNLFGVISQFFEYSEITPFERAVTENNKWNITGSDLFFIIVYVISIGLVLLIDYLNNKYSKRKIMRDTILEDETLVAERIKVNRIKYSVAIIVGLGLAILCSHFMKVYFRPTEILYSTMASCTFAWSVAYSAIVNFVVFEYKTKRMMVSLGVCYAMFIIICLIMGGPWYHYPV